jgi:hypothetical protein
MDCQKSDGRSLYRAICISLTTETLLLLFEPQLTGISTLALGLEGYEEAQTASGIVFYTGRSGSAR